MNYFPLLPPLQDGKAPSNIEAPGEWLKRGSEDLYGIIQSLQVKSGNADYRRVDSIPYMWARPLLFEMALCDTNHPLHERIRGEWRGLLALLALNEWYDFRLSVAPIEFPEKRDGDDGEESEAPEFLDALHRLSPPHTLDASTTWDKLDVILFNDTAIGITSPTTLVSTSADYSNSLLGVRWFDGQFLTDPVLTLNDDAKKAVAGWLTNLHRNAIDGLPILGGKDSNQIEERIKEIANELKGELTLYINELDVDPKKPPVFSKKAIGFTQRLFREGMDAPVEPVEFSSSVEVVRSPDRRTDTKLLIVDESIADHWEVDPQNVIIWGTMTLAEYKDSIDKRLPPVPEHVHIRKPKDLFTDELCVIVQENAFIGSNTLLAEGSGELEFQGNRVTPIPPIKEELLTYLNAENLNERITFRKSAGGIEVEIRLTLTGLDGAKKREFTISREYLPKNGEIKSINSVPVLEIWPNFRAEKWKVYYTYFTTADQDTFQAEPLAPPEERSKSGSFEITRTACFPEAMICKYGGIEIGIVLINAPAELPVDEDAIWSIGVDFGTTNTIVYRKSPLHDPLEVKFDSRLLHIADSSQPNKLMEDFVPERHMPHPFLSLFQRFTSPGDKTEEPLVDGHIYFPGDINDLRYAPRISSNLKWSEDSQVRSLTRVFLKQVCLQCAAEAISEGAGEISWRFSFPTAFSQTDKEQFQQIWDSVVKHCSDATGMRNKKISHQQESIVTPKYFASTLGGFASGALCIDIGGETSDISIWQDNELYWQSSLRFAGRHIFLDRLRANPGILKRFGVESSVVAELEGASKVSPDDFYALANVIIKHHAQDWLNGFVDHSGRPEVKTFVRFIAVGISGLLYYIGLVLKYLGSERGFLPNMLSVYIGGNGARILHWIANGRFEPNRAIVPLLEEMLLGVSGLDHEIRFDIRISDSPKHEAAHGLVTDKFELRWSDANNSANLSGESFIEDGTNFDWKEILTADRLKKRLRMPEQLAQLDDFVASFNRHTGRGNAIETPIRLREEDADSIWRDLEDILQNQADANVNDIHVEPLFILSLKLFLERLDRNVE